MDTDRIRRRVLERPENRLWLGVDPPVGLEGLASEFSSSDDLGTLSEDEYWGMVSSPEAGDGEESEEESGDDEAASDGGES